MHEEIPHMEWEPEVPELHRWIVDTGMFDRMPQADEFEQDEAVIARHNGEIYHVREIDGVFVHIWYETPDKKASETVSRDSVRPINTYAQIVHEITGPGLEITIDKQGHATIKRPRRPNGPRPPFPGPLG